MVDGVNVGAVSSYTFNNVTTNHTIAVAFAYNGGVLHFENACAAKDRDALTAIRNW